MRPHRHESSAWRKALARVLAIACVTLPAARAAPPFWYLQGESSGVKNDDGALVANYRAGRTAETFVHLAARSPLVWARYNPGQAIGHILVTRALKLPDGTTEVRVSAFRPVDGARFSSGGAGRRLTYFGAVNPFAQFDAQSDDYFRGINFTAFLAATGLVMRSVNASVALVHYPALISTQALSASGSELAWRISATVRYDMQGRWLLGVQGESGDERGFVPAYRVLGCDVALDPRNGCVVKGFASFIAWNDGNLPSAIVAFGSRSGAERPDLGRIASAFEGLEGYLRDASLWREAAWNSIAGVSAPNAMYALAAAKIHEGALERRDRLAEINSAAPRRLSATLTSGVASAGSPSAWDPADAATAEFVMKPLEEAGGGGAIAARAANWRPARDTAASEDMRTREGTSVAVRVINGTTP